MAEKKKQILILSRRDNRPDYDTAQSVVKALGSSAHGIQYSDCFLEEVAFVFDGDKLSALDMRNNKDLADYDGAFLIGWFKRRRHEEVAFAVAAYMEGKGKKFLNSETLKNRSRGKLSQYMIAALNSIAAAPFIAVKDTNSAKGLIEKSGFKYPLIVKSASASRGDKNYLVRNDGELQNALDSMPSKLKIIQKFAENDGDYRLLVMGGKVRLAIHRQSQTDSHLNNTSQGGSATLVDVSSLNPQMLEDSVKIAGLLNREVTGVDMIIDKQTGEYYFLEANNMPQLSTGSLVVQKSRALDDFFNEWIN